jgi:heterodisulfide reductase subunit A-like polyferredoxin
MTAGGTERSGRGGKPGAVLVVGAGIAGIQSSLDLANAGFKVYLLESGPAIGGIMAQLDKTFPTNDCAMCIMSPKLVECGRHFNIELLSDAQIEEVTGEAGDFRVKVLKRPRFVDPAKCTGCAECEKVCPVKLPSRFDERLVDRRAIYRLFAQAYPSAFSIDKKARPACQVSCPAGVHAQGYVALVREKKYHEAYELVRKHNPFVSICGRVCHHPCETNCRRGEYDEPIAIAAIKRFIADREYEERGTKNEERGTENAGGETAKDAKSAKGEGKRGNDEGAERSGGEAAKSAKAEITSKKTVGVVGAGPSGLTCALRLRDQGYAVTVYDEAGEPGGMLVSCLPEYRIPKARAMQDIERILAAGIELKSGTKVGCDVTLKELEKRYDALYLAVGCQAGADLPGPAVESKRVVLGLDFLRQAKRGAKIEGLGRKVVVIGGGNVAVDCARTAARLGAEEVSMVCLETRNLDSRDRMPAHVWEIEAAEEEGVVIRCCLGPKRIVTKSGRVTGVETMRCTSVYSDDGSFAPVYDKECVTETIPADTVIVAIGQRSQLEGFETLKQTRGRIEADPVTLETSVPGIFAGGDIVSGPASIVEAVHHGNEAAVSISRYLAGENLREGRRTKDEERRANEELPEKELPEFVEKKPRQQMPVLAAGKRVRNFAECELGLNEEQALAEASRCLECGVCSECLECERVCEAHAVVHEMPAQHREIGVGAIILANGAEKYNPRLKYEFGFGMYPNVVTSIQFERILAASGPFGGHLQRPGDGKAPKRIAWVQCVGSRDDEAGNTYCSSVCCMYGIKEAVIAKEHARDIEATIFYMDIRTHGKDFDRYYERAKKEHGVRFVRARVGKVDERPESGNLIVHYANEGNGGMRSEEFDMVVLSVGFSPPADAPELADKLGIRLNRHRFFQTARFCPTETTRPGIFVCGAAAAPKDIPETVTQASAAASGAAEIMHDARGTEVVQKTYPPERSVAGEAPRIGVFVCRCGINIASTVDVPSVAAYARTLPDVVHVDENLFTCSQDTQHKIKTAIEEHKLNRVVVASCTPRTHEPLFQETLREAGLNPHLFEMANIRDQCSWTHMREPERATAKAKSLVEMAVAKAGLLEPLKTVVLPVTQKALVLGGGLAGMVSALSIAEQGFEVTLIEREKELGGNARNLRYSLEGADVKAYLGSLMARVETHPRIKVYKGASAESIQGYIGNYKTKIKIAGRDYEPEVEHGVVVVATGAKEARPKEYLYGEDDRVITQLELEQRIAGADATRLARLKNVVMIQCVGSRDEERPYCSRVCCQDAVKNALKLKELNPKVNVYVFCRDVRTYGFLEEYYQRARDLGVVFVRYEPEEKPTVERDGDKLVVKARDSILGAALSINPDLVVLASGIIPHDDAAAVSRMLKIPLNEDGFFLEAHVKLRPVDFATEGVFLAGLAHSPKNIQETVAQAKAAAARAATILAKDTYEAGATTAVVNDLVCAGCGICASVCAYGAPGLVEKDGKTVSRVNEALCKGCGNCTAACPSGAMSHLGFNSRQTRAMLRAALRAASEPALKE